MAKCMCSPSSIPRWLLACSLGSLLAFGLAAPSLAETSLAGTSLTGNGPGAAEVAHPPAASASSVASTPFILDNAQRARIALLVDEISEFNAAQLDAAAQQSNGAASADLVLAVLLRAGRPMPPGLSTARRAQRAEHSKEALSWLRVALTNPQRADLVGDAISAALDVASPAPELSVAAMRVVARLDLVAHALEVARWLDAGAALDSALAESARDGELDSSPRMKLSAQSALYQLYGRWFEDAATFRAQWEILRGRTPDGTGRDELLSAIQTADQRALTLIEFAPSRLGHSLIDWPSPMMRANAARAIGRAVAAGTLLPAAAREALVDGLPSERSEEALAARLRTLLDLTQGADPTGEAARSVRELVFDVAEQAKSRSCEEIWVMIGALTRLAQPFGSEGDPARSETLKLGVELFERAMRRGEVRSLDPDALHGAIKSLSDLVRSISDESVASEVGRPLVQLVRPMVLGEEGASRRAAIPLRVRRAAAEAFALSVQPSDAKDLVALVRSMETPELEYELLGALRAVIAVVEPGGENAEAVIDELFEAAAEPEFDSRARALELLLSEDVRPALLAKPRATEARWALARLQAEPSPELQVSLAELLGLIGDESSLERLLVSDAADPSGASHAPLSELAGSSEELVMAAAKLARDLSETNPTLRSRAAYLIAGQGSTPEEPDAFRPLRGRAALDLMLSVDLDALEPPAERAKALAWIFPLALELRHLTPGPMAAYFTSSEAPALRLRELSLPDGTMVADGDPPVLALLRSLMRADLARAAAEAGIEPSSEAAQSQTLSEIMEGFDVAFAKAPVGGPTGAWTASAIMLESVALLRALDRPEAALNRLDRLVSKDFAPDPARIPAGTIRLYVELAREATPFTGRSQERAEKAATLCTNLLTRPSWLKDAPDVRLADLESSLQVASMAEGREVGAQLKAAIAKAAAPEWRADLEQVDAERAASVWKAIDPSGSR